jgi:predicted molibdopterin-dependent oxidoreductase YjgC
MQPASPGHDSDICIILIWCRGHHADCVFVRTEGSPKMFRACATPVAEGMSIITHDPEIVKSAPTTLELIPVAPPTTTVQVRAQRQCELQRWRLSSAFAKFH